jgi:hypothetical protein
MLVSNLQFIIHNSLSEDITQTNTPSVPCGKKALLTKKTVFFLHCETKNVMLMRLAIRLLRVKEAPPQHQTVQSGLNQWEPLFCEARALSTDHVGSLSGYLTKVY